MKIFGSISEIVNLVFRKNSQAVTFRPNQATTYTASRDIQTPPQDADSILVSQNASQTLTNKTIDGDDNTVQDLALTSLKTVLGDANEVIRRDAAGVVVSGPNTIPNNSEILTTDSTAALTNKSYDADGTGNVLTNVDNGNIKAGAAIDATKIHDGSVDNTEFGYLNGVTSAIQTQIDGKVTGPGSATDNALVRFDGTTGKLVQNSIGILADTGELSGLTQLDVDNLRLDVNTLSITNVNGNLRLLPNGTGIIDAQGAVQVVGSLRSDTSLILEETGAGTDTITIAAPASIAASYSLTLPTTDGNASEFLQTDGSGILTWATPAGAQTSSVDIKNHSIAGAAAANALTVSLKDAAGSDPSALSPVNISFRSTTATTGTYTVRTISAAVAGETTVTIPSGTSIGINDGIASNIFVYAVDDNGTIKLALSNRLFDEGSLMTTTAISGGTSPVVLYSTSAIGTPRPIRCLGKMVVTPTATSLWTNPTEITSTPFEYSESNIYSDNARVLTLITGATSQILTAGRRQVLYYRFADGTHRMRFNVSFTLSGGASSINLFTFSIGGVTFATYDQRQPVSVLNADFNTTGQLAGCTAASANINLYTSANITGNGGWCFSGDVELSAKPTWAP